MVNQPASYFAYSLAQLSKLLPIHQQTGQITKISVSIKYKSKINVKLIIGDTIFILQSCYNI